MRQSRLKIEFRQKQLYRDNDIAQPIVVVCTDGVASYADGLVPKPDWQDVTDDTDGETLSKIKFTWTAVTEDYSRSGTETNAIGSNYDKGLSADLTFSGEAFKYIYDWLMTNPCQGLNSIEVRITDIECNKAFRLFEIKLDNVEYEPDDAPCIVSMSLREKDDAIHVFRKTIIEDDWQNWFNSTGTSVKSHPTMQYVVEKKPSFILDVLLCFGYMVGILAPASLFTNDLRDWYRRILGLTYYSPSPYIRDLLLNVCMKYGFTMNTIFDDVITNPYRDSVMFFPVNSYYVNNRSFSSPSTQFIWDNRTGIPASEFLDQLKQVFNAEWYITPNNELVFQNEQYFKNLPAIYDFTAPGAAPIYNRKYIFNGQKKPAYGNYAYRLDPQDSSSNDLKWRYNDIVDFDGEVNNPMLEGSVKKVFDFAPTSFMYDGATEDFIARSVSTAQLVAGGILLVGLIAILAAAGPLTAVVTAALLGAAYVVVNSFFVGLVENSDIEGSIRTSSNVVNVPRLLVHDRNTPFDRAKAVFVTDPAVNTYYNPDSVNYYAEHPAFDAPAGYFGSQVTKVWNYPYYLDAKYTNNLFDRFHEIDNPLNDPEINQEWSGNVDLCCDMMTLFGCWDGYFIKIGAKVIVEKRLSREISVRLTKIEPDYDQGKMYLEGKVLK